eukprot:CAMPEP_0113331136 /NCGR_PEP_ID=MMETSP0010_2-20120614/22283_1 /TAXON_ID=216773 ORGANISM="Corethron hystrix, Strain 308" /NCGR_SAMPLE_ID=MMETSP0010_2 /ASSEMBLY_ACC=CAM_ASM_000155 /LENGTH=594 /DNA_ID=CAMNT_0000194293 /DNA_START=47 /DNA_END=1834 /DNA_ORIENTATION=+ /assembly_acc=CAM_ASM_000155
MTLTKQNGAGSVEKPDALRVEVEDVTDDEAPGPAPISPDAAPGDYDCGALSDDDSSFEGQTWCDVSVGSAEGTSEKDDFLENALGRSIAASVRKRREEEAEEEEAPAVVALEGEDGETSETASPPPKASPELPELPTDPNVCGLCERRASTFCRRCSVPLCGVHCHHLRSLIPPSSICFGPLNPPSSSISASEIIVRQAAARVPLPTCHRCRVAVLPLQRELRRNNSNAVRYNAIDEAARCRRHFNSPLAFSLGHEVRKAAYALNNILPRVRRRDPQRHTRPETVLCDTRRMEHCRETLSTISPDLSNLDGVAIPATLLSWARGIAVFTAVRRGLGFGLEFGTGLVVRRLDKPEAEAEKPPDLPEDDDAPGDPQWSAPCAIGLFGMAWGALAGIQLADHVLLCMTDESVERIMGGNGAITLGADLGVALGPLGRHVEAAAVGEPRHKPAAVFSYSMSKGLYAGASLEGKIIATRHGVNERFYGSRVDPQNLLRGDVPPPSAARPLYDALRRCHVYAKGSQHRGSRRVSYYEDSKTTGKLSPFSQQERMGMFSFQQVGEEKEEKGKENRRNFIDPQNRHGIRREESDLDVVQWPF